jgi:hypothetical protein
MASAPPQGFTATSLDIASATEEENMRREAKDNSLMKKNNALLDALIKQFELVTNEENITGDEKLNGRT